MSRRSTRKMDRKGLRILHANQYRVIQEASAARACKSSEGPLADLQSAAKPPPLLY